MLAVSETSPVLDTSQERTLESVRTGYTHFAEGDVLFAKITPCMENGKGAVATGLRRRAWLRDDGIARRPSARRDSSALPLPLPCAAFRPQGGEGELHRLGRPGSCADELHGRTGSSSSADSPSSGGLWRSWRRCWAKWTPASSGWRRFRVLLKRFRQSVLAAACSGRLTADWRATKLARIARGSTTRKARRDAGGVSPNCRDDWLGRPSVTSQVASGARAGEEVPGDFHPSTKMTADFEADRHWKL